MSVLRIATDTSTGDARRLIAAIASEFPHTDTPGDIIEMEVGAIASFKRLAERLDDDPMRRRHEWTIAKEAAAAWEWAAAIWHQLPAVDEIGASPVDQRE